MVDVLETSDVPISFSRLHAQLLACFLLQLSDESYVSTFD